MTTARLLVGDVFERMAELEDGSVDLLLTSPPFYNLRAYLPDGHADKAKEIGSEATPAEYLDTLLELTAVWRRLLAPHGSIAVELGDTYAGSGGAGGDYADGGLRDGQPKFRQPRPDGEHPPPLEKSLLLLATLYPACLAYGRNLLTGEPSPAGQWRIRNLKPWIRSNPPVGALGDKERPATSYITVATLARDRWFDLDAVRTTHVRDPATISLRHGDNPVTERNHNHDKGEFANSGNPAGAPPLDWYVDADAVIDAEIDQRAGSATRTGRAGKPISEADARRLDAANSGGVGHGNRYSDGASSVGARGVHIRRALEAAGILTTHDALDVSPKGYAGAHYAVWPPELCRLLIDEMCPRHVCTTCGEPRRRIVNKHNDISQRQELAGHIRERRQAAGLSVLDVAAWFPSKTGGLTGCVSNWETAANVPTAEQWTILKDRLGLSDEFDNLVRGERRWTETLAEYIPHGEDPGRQNAENYAQGQQGHYGGAQSMAKGRATKIPRDAGWSDCGHGTWRPGHVLDPFAGSGTTLAVATGMARDSTGIDLDPRNADLALERCGMFLEIDHGPQGDVA